MRNVTACVLLALAYNAEPQSPAAPASVGADAEAAADRMLNALGGRRAWAALTTLVNDSQQNRVEEPTVVRAVISLDVTQPRFRIETTAPDLHLIRVVDGERNWRLSREGKIEPVPQATLTGDARWYAGHVYRTIHRIAKRDASIRLALAADARLEVYEGPARVAWFKLDARGEPYAFGSHDDDKGSLSGPWNVLQDGIHHPSWTAVADGTWRAQLVSFRANVPLDDALFTQPARIASFAQLSGEWRGAGTFRGAPTDIALSWQPALGGAFQRLEIALTSESQSQAVFSGQADYRQTLEGISAQWLDSMGNRYPVRARIDGSCLRAEWGEPSRAPGRSSYCLQSDTALRVTDQIQDRSGRWQVFGRYDLQRSR